MLVSLRLFPALFARLLFRVLGHQLFQVDLVNCIDTFQAWLIFRLIKEHVFLLADLLVLFDGYLEAHVFERPDRA